LPRFDEDPTQHEGGGHRLLTALVLTGRRVSHFQVAELLGGGGMGVLYRAEDTRLGRIVALKFLAPELVRDEIAKARFLTEARAASALEHPNLCTILEVGETEEGLLFLAMPLYQGESLDYRLARGPLPVEQALDIATQVARGLAKAHQQGIVHRDVKPANLFLTADGVVKVLDFGIAKLSREAGPTQQGLSLGTPQYMAPEQTRGEEVDARADVWSLGTVLYQMLAGRPPFTGGTGAAVVYAVLHEEPKPLEDLRPEVPPEIARIVSRMLERDPEERYADAGEALADLRRVQGLASTTIASGSPPSAGHRRRRIARPVVLGLALLAAAGLVALLAWRRSGPPAPQPTNFIRLTDLPGSETFPSLSPDGTFFVYAKAVGGNSDLFLQRVAGGNPIDLTAGSPADDTQPAFSPNGQQIAFRSNRDGGGIFLMGATGESIRRLTDFGFNPAWSPDGREIAVGTDGAFDPVGRTTLKSQIFRVDVETGKIRSLGVGDGVQPAWSPHGWRIAFWGFTGPGFQRAIWTVPADGGAPVAVIDDAFYNWSPVWAPDGRFLYFASNRGGSMNLWRVAVDEKSGAVSGAPQPVTTPAEWSALPSLSRDGHLLIYATKDSRTFVDLAPFDPGSGQIVGVPTLVFQGPRSVRSCDISPDGAWLVLAATAPQEDLILVRRDGSEVRQLTNDPARDRKPSWSPDGRRIVFSSNRSGKYEAWTIRPDGSGLTQVTNLPDQTVLSPIWSPDGKQIAFSYGARGTGIVDLSGAPARPRVLPPVSGGRVFAPTAWSQDGRFLGGVLFEQGESQESEVPGIVLWSLADDSYRHLTRDEGYGYAFWLGNGARQVLSFGERSGIKLVDAVGGGSRKLLAPTRDTRYADAKIGADNRTLCAVRFTDEGDIWSLSLHAAPARP
jgi:eukaryotic-like serine/threonine-protein kinase